MEKKKKNWDLFSPTAWVVNDGGPMPLLEALNNFLLPSFPPSAILLAP